MLDRRERQDVGIIITIIIMIITISHGSQRKRRRCHDDASILSENSGFVSRISPKITRKGTSDIKESQEDTQ